MQLARFSRVRQTLSLIAALRRVRQPFTTPEGFRESVQLLLHLARLIGMQSRELVPLQKIVQEEAVFQTTWGIVQYLGGLVHGEQSTQETLTLTARDGSQVAIPHQAFLRWLPVVAQLLSLLRQLRA